jgi:hypothetical protein
MMSVLPVKFPKFLTKNFDPERHKSKADLIKLVQLEIELYWYGEEEAIRAEGQFAEAVKWLKKLRGLR